MASSCQVFLVFQLLQLFVLFFLKSGFPRATKANATVRPMASPAINVRCILTAWSPPRVSDHCRDRDMDAILFYVAHSLFGRLAEEINMG